MDLEEQISEAVLNTTEYEGLLELEKMVNKLGFYLIELKLKGGRDVLDDLGDTTEFHLFMDLFLQCQVLDGIRKKNEEINQHKDPSMGQL